MLKLDITGFTAEEILNYTLAGLMARHQHLAAKIADIRSQLSGAPGATASPVAKRGPGRPAAAVAAPKAAKTPVRRKLSPEALANIVAAQKKRWAKVHKAKRAADKLAAGAPPKGSRRILLAEPEFQQSEESLAATGD